MTMTEIRRKRLAERLRTVGHMPDHTRTTKALAGATAVPDRAALKLLREMETDGEALGFSKGLNGRAVIVWRPHSRQSPGRT